MSRDTFGGVAAATQGLHRYTYVGNRPTVLVDPTGHCFGPAIALAPICIEIAKSAVIGVVSYVGSTVAANVVVNVVGEHLLLGALGIRSDGLKVPLGVVEGTVENEAVVLALLADLLERGLDASAGLLFVVDGGTGIGAGLRRLFGMSVMVARCRRHKERNVLARLPEIERPLVQRRLRSAWAEPDPVRAKALLEALARSLAHQRPGAAASLREGLADTLTLTRLGVTGSLRRTVESTNPMESMIEIVRDHATRVKRWESGEMALRWAAAGMLAAESQFRRVKGFRELPALAAALRRELGLPEGEEAAIA